MRPDCRTWTLLLCKGYALDFGADPIARLWPGSTLHSPELWGPTLWADAQLPSDWTAVRMSNSCKVATTGTGVGMMSPSF
ncbi:hypothetical protein EYF80_030138 [Liparis tanakae]|uniref:Uncharacterized protein n=1 Tax=Liparis tanakae TaxID=230148 RepID=A0A4Z2H430_9TELE|nr:hypothetical protein EYF80_030138 [Liparis tanakae]